MFGVPAVGKPVGGAGMSRHPFSDLLANALVCGAGVGVAAAGLLDGVKCSVDAVDEKCLHGECVSVLDGV